MSRSIVVEAPVKAKKVKIAKIAFTPLTERVLVKQESAPEKIGSLYLPEDAKRKPTKGEVVAVADDLKNKSVVIGATVWYGQYSGFEITLGTEKYLVLKEEDLIGIEG